MRETASFVVCLLVVVSLCGCGRQEAPPSPPTASPGLARVEDALPPDGFLAGWKAIPGSYIYSASEDELWKIYDGAAPGVINQGGREAVTQSYENTEGGADKSFRVFVLRFVDQPHALAYLKEEVEGAGGGEELTGVDAGEIFNRGKAPWARFVVGPHLVSINWEGSDDDTDDAAVVAVRAIAATFADGV